MAPFKPVSREIMNILLEYEGVSLTCSRVHCALIADYCLVRSYRSEIITLIMTFILRSARLRLKLKGHAN